MTINSKQEYYALAGRGLLGNKFRTWDGFDEWYSSGYLGPIRFRSKIPGSKIFTTHAPYFGTYDTINAYRALLAKGASAAEVVFCEPAPEEYLTFQGEVCRTYQGLQLHWSTEPGITNREAMTRARYSSGLSAKLILQRFLDPSDYDDFTEFLDDYPGHVVEFSTYSVPVGIFWRRTVVWEIRAY